MAGGSRGRSAAHKNSEARGMSVRRSWNTKPKRGDRAGLIAMAVGTQGPNSPRSSTNSTKRRLRTLSIRPDQRPASTKIIGPAASAFSAAGEALAHPTLSLWSDARTSQTILRARSGFFSPRGIPRTRSTDCGDVAVDRPGADRRLSWTSQTNVSPTSGPHQPSTLSVVGATPRELLRRGVAPTTRRVEGWLVG